MTGSDIFNFNISATFWNCHIQYNGRKNYVNESNKISLQHIEHVLELYSQESRKCIDSVTQEYTTQEA